MRSGPPPFHLRPSRSRGPPQLPRSCRRGGGRASRGRPWIFGPEQPISRHPNPAVPEVVPSARHPGIARGKMLKLPSGDHGLLAARLPWASRHREWSQRAQPKRSRSSASSCGKKQCRRPPAPPRRRMQVVRPARLRRASCPALRSRCKSSISFARRGSLRSCSPTTPRSSAPSSTSQTRSSCRASPPAWRGMLGPRPASRPPAANRNPRTARRAADIRATTAETKTQASRPGLCTSAVHWRVGGANPANSGAAKSLADRRPRRWRGPAAARCEGPHPCTAPWPQRGIRRAPRAQRPGPPGPTST
mmetsp:Transcript_22152/g.75981  ORF Transcript_22152/g.75981 Transcript_22152/m.75981 type:complete len:305 (+) Transcript_22152:1986-2900(+)